MSQAWKPFVLLAVAILPASAQIIERRADVGNGPPDGSGKCTIEVVVDIRAEVEIQQDSALLRTLAGQRPQWRRFQCTSVMPLQPMGFHLTKTSGRGRIKLTLDPTRGGPAVILIDDPQTGSESYTIEISWTGTKQEKSSTAFPDPIAEPAPDRKRPVEAPPKPKAPETGFVRPYEPAEAVHECEDAAIDRAIERFHAQAVAIRSSARDTAAGHDEGVVGTLETRRGKQWDVYRFTCSVDFRERKMRSVDLEAAGPRR